MNSNRVWLLSIAGLLATIWMLIDAIHGLLAFGIWLCVQTIYKHLEEEHGK